MREAYQRPETGRGCDKSRSFRYEIAQNFDHLKASLNKKIILGEYSTFFKPSTWNCLHLEGINLCRNDFYRKDFVSKPPVTRRSRKHQWDRLRFVFYLCIDERRSVLKGFESFKQEPTWSWYPISTSIFVCIRQEVKVKMNSKRKYQVDLKPTNGFVKSDFILKLYSIYMYSLVK